MLLSLDPLFARVSEYCIRYIIAKVHRNRIADHLLYISFCAFKIEVFRECLYHAALKRSQRSYSFK